VNGDTESRVTTRRAAIAALLMAAGAGASYALTPRQKLASLRAVKLNLDVDVPSAFGDWRIDTASFAGIVNPETEQLLNRIYSQQLSRTYVDGAGHRIMVSIVYGEDQRQSGGNAMHAPEVCYPAQGFEVKANRIGLLQLPGGAIPVRRLETQLGARRPEPVTYWTTLGDEATLGGVKRRMIELRYGLKGVVADGVLFRVSSIGSDPAEQFRMQDHFLADLMRALSPRARQQLAGLA
jgi:EpsI family protein